MAKNYFNIVDISVVLVSLVTFVLDVVTDIIVCIGLLLDGHTVWGWLGITFIAVPAVLMSGFSLVWHIQDKTVTPFIIVTHLLLLAPAERYLKVSWLGLKAYRAQKVVFTQKAIRAQSDASLLRLIEAFLESAPQLVLQLYILLCKERGNWFAGVSAGCSLVSLTLAMTTYCDTRCQAHSTTYWRHILGLLVHWSWQLFMTAARIAAFVFFACAVHCWVFAVMGGHWLISFVWISVRGTDFGTGYEKWLFRMACAFSYIFVFLNLNEGKSRWRITAYYLLALVENTGMLVVFLVMENSHMILLSCLVVYAGFFIGVACMLIYYLFLHPSGSGKRYFRPRLRSSNTSRISAGPHIFNVESPKPPASIEGGTINPNLAVNSSLNPASKIEQASHRESASSHQASKAASSSKQTLQMAWQSGMESSSDSSSSLASTENSRSLIKRTSSVKSDNSHGSTSSDNQLLPQVITKNSQSKSPKKSLTSELAQLDYLKQGLPRDSGNINEHIEESSSPTLSKDSWATLSDQAMQLCVLGDFTVLGIDESSSTDKRVSDSSTFSSQQHSLSPLDALLLWKNSHVRLRSTIAATIAAATCNQSSDEGTPRKSQYFSSSSVVSGQDESFLSSIHMKSLSNNTTFMELSSSSQEQVSISQRSSQDSSRHREALSTLPDIIETFDHDDISDFESRENSYEKCADEDLENTMTEVSANIVNNCSSSYQVDSTLTISKLGVKKPRSYLASQRRADTDYQGPISSRHPYPMAAESSRPPVEHLLSTPNSDNKIECKGDSPFTDQELVTVMTKSLQNYIDGNSSGNSNNPEREGLALTLEDLRISRESTPESSPLSRKDLDGWKTRSASSLFHDSTYSSPPSSASKMNRTESIKTAEAKLSPNAFKQIENLPQRLHCLDVLQKATDQAVATIQHSHALKFIMDSYASTALPSPCVATTASQKLSSSDISHKPIPTPQKSSNRAPPDIISHNSMTQSQLRSQSLPYDMKEIIDLPPRPKPIEQNSLHRRSIGNYSLDINSCPKNTHHKEFLDTTAWKRSHASQCQEVSDRVTDSIVHGGISLTKKLNVYSGKLSDSQYKKSHLYEQILQEKGSDSGSEAGGYVSGQYCPPLCGNDATDSEANSIQQNLDHERKGSKYDLNKISKPISELFFDERKHLSTSDVNTMDPLKKEIIRRDIELGKQRLNQHVDGAHLTPRFHVCQSHPCGKCSSSVHPYDSVSRALQTSDHPTLKASGHRSQTRSHVMDRMTEDELQLSAKHVAEYFSEALETSSSSLSYGPRPSRKHCQPVLQVHSCRQPLQRLDNSQHLSPGANNYSTENRRNMNTDSRNHTQISRHKYAASSEVHQHRSDGEHSGQHLRQYSSDLPKARRLFEPTESKSGVSRPPLHESKTVTSRKSVKSNARVRFSMEADQERYFQQIYHKKDQSNS